MPLNTTEDLDLQQQPSCAQITQYELDVIVEHHRQTIVRCAFGNIALRTWCSGETRHAAHAANRLAELKPQALEAVYAEIEANQDKWTAFAEAEARREERDQDAPANSADRIECGEGKK